MIGWNFPPNNYGQVTGLNDAGIETFRGNPWVSLAREINQNSCDARGDDPTRPVEVHFTLEYVPSSAFPEKDEFIKVLQSCHDYWIDNPKTSKFFEYGLDIMNQEKIAFLKISDYNTTGLVGALEENKGGWHNLIKSVGSSNKSSQSGGSFGIGKHAPFACSDLRTVFYCTYDKNGVFAFQGVSKLVTHKAQNGEPTQGTGYFGLKEKNSPILESSELNSFFHRSRVGTDVFVAGFHAEEGWESKIIKSVLDNFFVAIIEQKLVVKVGKTTINSATITDLLEKYMKDDTESYAYQYYESLTVTNRLHFYEDNFLNMGRLDLFVLPGKNMSKRVAMVRSTGMKIYDKGNFRTPFRFSGVLLAKGEELNEFLRQIEPPTHTSWEPERFEDPDFAKSVIKKLYAWINEKIKSITVNPDTEELDVEGISEYLADSIEEAASLHTPLESNKTPDRSVPQEVEIEIIKKRLQPSMFAGGEEVGNESLSNNYPDANNSYRDDEAENNRENNAAGNEDDDKESDRDVDQEDQLTDRDAPEDDGSEEGKSSSDSHENGASAKRKPLRLKHSRVFCVNPIEGSYKLSIQTDDNGLGYLGVKIIGEVGSEPAPIKSAFIEGIEEPIHVSNDGKLGPINFTKDGKRSIIITLKESLRCALEVTIHAN